MDLQHHACFWPLKPVHLVTPSEKRAMDQVEQPDFDPTVAFEWPEEHPGEARDTDPALK
jgi:hypothetical protein